MEKEYCSCFLPSFVTSFYSSFLASSLFVLPFFLPFLLPSWLPLFPSFFPYIIPGFLSFYPSFLPSFYSSFLTSFLTSSLFFLPSCLPYFPLFFLPGFLPCFLSFLPCFLQSILVWDDYNIRIIIKSKKWRYIGHWLENISNNNKKLRWKKKRMIPIQRGNPMFLISKQKRSKVYKEYECGLENPNTKSWRKKKHSQHRYAVENGGFIWYLVR